MKQEVKEDLVLKVDDDICIGCGSCEAVCPEYFELNSEGKSKVKRQYFAEDEELIKEAKDTCPVDAILLEKKTEEKED